LKAVRDARFEHEIQLKDEYIVSEGQKKVGAANSIQEKCMENEEKQKISVPMRLWCKTGNL
jgi:hypothetical protein